MPRKTFLRRTTILLGRQVARVQRVTRRGRTLWEQAVGEDSFAQLFPDLVGQEMVIDAKGLELAGQPRRLLAFLWLQQNGYL